MSAHMDAIKLHLVNIVYNDKTVEFKKVISEILENPVKLNNMPAFVELFSKNIFNFNALQNELGISFEIVKECVRDKHHTALEFLHEIKLNNKDIDDLEYIINVVGTDDSVGASAITFNLDEDKLKIVCFNAERGCSIVEFKKVISELLEYPADLNEMPAFVELFSKNIFNSAALQSELGINFDIVKKYVQDKHHTALEFLHEIEVNNKDIHDLEEIFKIGNGDRATTFNLNKDNLGNICLTLSRGCPPVDEE